MAKFERRARALLVPVPAEKQTRAGAGDDAQAPSAEEIRLNSIGALLAGRVRPVAIDVVRKRHLADGAEIAAVGAVLVFHAEEGPRTAPHHLQHRQCGRT